MVFEFLCSVLKNTFVVVGRVVWEVRESKKCVVFTVLTNFQYLQWYCLHFCSINTALKLRKHSKVSKAVSLNMLRWGSAAKEVPEHCHSGSCAMCICIMLHDHILLLFLISTVCRLDSPNEWRFIYYFFSPLFSGLLQAYLLPPSAVGISNQAGFFVKLIPITTFSTMELRGLLASFCK